MISGRSKRQYIVVDTTGYEYLPSCADNGSVLHIELRCEHCVACTVFWRLRVLSCRNVAHMVSLEWRYVVALTGSSIIVAALIG